MPSAFGAMPSESSAILRASCFTVRTSDDVTDMPDQIATELEFVQNLGVLITRL